MKTLELSIRENTPLYKALAHHAEREGISLVGLCELLMSMGVQMLDAWEIDQRNQIIWYSNIQEQIKGVRSTDRTLGR